MSETLKKYCAAKGIDEGELIKEMQMLGIWDEGITDLSQVGNPGEAMWWQEYKALIAENLARLKAELWSIQNEPSR